MAKTKKVTLKVEGEDIDEVMANLEQKLRAMIEEKRNEISDLERQIDAVDEKADQEVGELRDRKNIAADNLNHLQQLLVRVDP